MKFKPTSLTEDIMRKVMDEKPQAYCLIEGKNNISGTVTFFDYFNKTILLYQINGLPKVNPCSGGVYAFHVHEGNDCKQPLMHYNPNECEHPYHLGDLPPLFTIEGKAWGLILVDKFSVNDIINRVIVVHEKADDFITQPSGNAGDRIACGTIQRF